MDDEEEYDYSDIFYGSGEGYSTEEPEEDDFVTESPSAGQGRNELLIEPHCSVCTTESKFVKL